MASSSKDIPDEVWSRHKDTILKLRFDESLPLDAARSKSRNIVQVMKEDHGFEATYYEIQLKKWKAAKNLKRKDWETILPIYNDLEKRGLKPRVRLGDQVLDERKVKKARRYLTSDHERIHESDALLTLSEQTRLWRIEYCRDDGEYTDHSGRHLGTNNREPSPSIALSLGETNTFPSAIQNQSAQESATRNLGQYRENTTSSQLVTYVHPSLSSPMLSFEDFESMPSFLLGQEIFQDTCLGSSHSDMNGLALTSAAGVENSDLILNELDPPLASSSDHLLVSAPGTVNLESLAFASKPRHYMNPSWFFQKTSSLLRLVGMSKGSSLMTQRAIPTSEVFKRVIFSIANNFAGLKNIPRAIILGMLKSFSKARSDLVTCLQSKNVKFSEPLADNLIRAAVEAGDEELVGIILDTTSGQANVVDINEIVCEVGYTRFSALALAAYLHRPAMVRKLLRHGAKVGGQCFTCECGIERVRGCRNCDICDCPLTVIYEQYKQPGQYRQRRDQYQYMRTQPDPACNVSEAAEIVKLILDNHPVMVTRLLKDPRYFMTTSDRLLELLAQAVPPDRHAEIFEPPRIRDQDFHTTKLVALCSIVDKLEPQRARQIISKLLSNCERMGCTGHKTSRSLNYVTNRAILSNKFELADYFLSIIQPDQGNLAAAIRSRRTDLVDSLLEQGALSHGDAPCCDGMSHPFDSGHCGKPTTPLAEAIRLQDARLIKRLEEYGALNRIFEVHRGDFTAALFATVEVGDCVFLKQLLSTASANFYRWNAIGTQINRPALYGVKRTPLQQACEMGSFEMVEFVVTKGALINAPPAKRGGATALQLAAISGSVRVVEFLLDNGAEIHAAPALEDGRTALEGAAEHGRVSVLDILLQRGEQGYSRDDISKARFYAEKERQRGCEERLKQALFWAGGQTHKSLN
ncbi:unnamed protein product [Clonostachys solani]|uniref:Clr5 domain-containing protein n=1 Tax=Clonostachys solani TaxID=160281 RepID=A0A9P0EFL7_9HYPO|nr:unnamed protein product [Clonostachys solani]